MQHVRKLDSMDIGGSRRGSAAVYGMAALLAVSSAYAMLLAQPRLIDTWSAAWRQLPFTSGAPSWVLPAVSAGLAIGSAAAGIALLAAFVRGVQARPYVWLSPVLVGFSTLVMVATPIPLPWPTLPSEVFALLAAPALLGGGAVMQMRGTASKAAGALLIALPAIALAAGFAALQHGGFGALPRLSPSAQLFLFVLALTSVGVAFVAVVTRGSAEAAAAASRWAEQGTRAGAALARVHAAELRASAAERRVQLAERRLAHGAAPAFASSAPLGDAELAEFKALARPGLSAWLISALAAAALGVAAAGLYFGLYQPLLRRAAEGRAFAVAAQKHAAAVGALRREFEAAQAQLKAELAAERERAAAALTAAQAAQEALARAEAAAAAAAPAAAPPVATRSSSEPAAAPAKPRSKAHSAKARRAARAAKPAARAAAKPAAKPGAAAKSAAAADKPEFDRETRRALRDSVSDDPLDGL